MKRIAIAVVEYLLGFLALAVFTAIALTPTETNCARATTSSFAA